MAEKPINIPLPCIVAPFSPQLAAQVRVTLGAKRKKGAKVHMAVDTLGYLLALHVTPANEQDRSQAGRLVQTVQEEICASVEISFVDQGYTSETAANEASAHGVELHGVKLHVVKL